MLNNVLLEALRGNSNRAVLGGERDNSVRAGVILSNTTEPSEATKAVRFTSNEQIRDEFKKEVDKFLAQNMTQDEAIERAIEELNSRADKVRLAQGIIIDVFRNEIPNYETANAGLVSDNARELISQGIKNAIDEKKMNSEESRSFRDRLSGFTEAFGSPLATFAGSVFKIPLNLAKIGSVAGLGVFAFYETLFHFRDTGIYGSDVWSTGALEIGRGLMIASATMLGFAVAAKTGGQLIYDPAVAEINAKSESNSGWSKFKAHLGALSMLETTKAVVASYLLGKGAAAGLDFLALIPPGSHGTVAAVGTLFWLGVKVVGDLSTAYRLRGILKDEGL